MKTKIILRQDVPNLGVNGDTLDVAPGYARNYLLPRSMAVPASARNLAKVAEQKQKISEENQKKLAAAQEEGKKIQALVCTITARAGDDGKLFGSVTTGEVSAELAKKGFNIDRRWIELREPIRTTGEFAVSVRLHPQVRASFKIQVNSATGA